MAFPSINTGVIKAQLKQAFDAQGHTAAVVLKDGSTFSIKVTEGFRRDTSLTAGISAETHRIRFLADDWDANVTRPPEKGDQVSFNGHRYAIQGRVRARGISDDLMMYVCEIQG